MVFSFLDGRIGYIDVTGKGDWSEDVSYDLLDEVDNKIWTARALSSFGDQSKYKSVLYGIDAAIIRGASKDNIIRRVGLHYSHLQKKSVDIFQAVEMATNKQTKAEDVKLLHSKGGAFENVLIGTPKK